MTAHPLGDVDVHDGREAADPGIGEHDVEAGEPLAARFDQASNIGFAPDITAVDPDRVTQLLLDRGESFGIEIGHHDRSPFSNQAPGGGETYSRGAAGDDGHSPIEMLGYHAAQRTIPINRRRFSCRWFSGSNRRIGGTMAQAVRKLALAGERSTDDDQQRIAKDACRGSGQNRPSLCSRRA